MNEQILRTFKGRSSVSRFIHERSIVGSGSEGTCGGRQIQGQSIDMKNIQGQRKLDVPLLNGSV